MLAAHSVTERVDRPCVLELPEDERDLVLEQRALLLVAETRLTAAIRGHQRQSGAIRDSHSQSGSAAISINQRSCASIRGSYMQSEAIRGNRRPSADQSGSSPWLRRGTRRGVAEGLERVVARLGHRVTQREECTVPDEGGH
jgi:hypothetical protein